MKLDIDPDHARTLRECLEDLQGRVDSGHLPDVGICGASGARGLGLRHALQRVTDTWPEHSGSAEYPVQDPAYTKGKGHRSASVARRAERIYGASRGRWTGPYGAARRRLLAWCIYVCRCNEEV